MPSITTAARTQRHGQATWSHAMPDDKSNEEKLAKELKKVVKPVTGNQAKKEPKKALKDILDKGKKK